MLTKPHPRFPQIKDAIQVLSKSGKAFSAICYRCTEPQFADQIVTGLGSQQHGARWTPKGAFPTVYLCETPEAALQEYLSRGRRMRLPDHRSLPMFMAWVKVKCMNLLDTTEPQVSALLAPLLAADKIHWRAIQNSVKRFPRGSAGPCTRFVFRA